LDEELGDDYLGSVVGDALDIDPALLANDEDALEMDDDDEFEDALDFNHVETTIEAHNPIEEGPSNVTGLGLDLGTQPVEQTIDMIAVDTPQEVKEEHPKVHSVTTTSNSSRRDTRGSKGSSDQPLLAPLMKTPSKPSPNLSNGKASTSPNLAFGKSISPTLSQKARRISRERIIATTPTSPEEEESLRIAMALQAQEFGLRSRRSGGA
jgi:hypothetical protein